MATAIAADVAEFLTAAKGRDCNKVGSMLKAKPELLNSEEAGGFAALHFAAFAGDADMIDLLLGHINKLELNKQNLDGNTPLMLAAKVQKHAAIKILVESGADVNFQGKGGATAVHHAAAMGNADTVQLLATLGAKIEKDPSESGSALHWACHGENQENGMRVIGTLVYDHGFNIDAVDAHGGTPLFVAIHMKRSDIVTFLLEHGANPNAVCPGDMSTPLHTAAECGTVADIKALIAFGADASLKNKDGKTAADLAEGKKPAHKELTKPAVDAKKRDDDAARFKAQGNKVFGEGESVKAAKFYTLAITLQPKNHVFFSNRSACNFNTKSFGLAYLDACRCVALNDTFVRGYFRKASTLKAMGELEASKAVVEAGLKLDTSNKDLCNLRDDLKKAVRKN